MMKRYKKLLNVLILSLLMLAIGACGNNNNLPPPPKPVPPKVELQKSELTLWVPKDMLSSVENAVGSFKAANTDREWNITVLAVEPEDAAEKILSDGSADVFVFAENDFEKLRKADVLMEVKRNTAAIGERNSKSAIDKVTSGGKLYAYPLSSEGGSLLFYNKSIISENDAKSIEMMLAAAVEGRKKIAIDFTDVNTMAAFLIPAGAKIEVVGRRNTTNLDTSKFVLMAEAIGEAVLSKGYQTGKAASVPEAFVSGAIAAGISTRDDAKAIKSALTTNYGVAALPTLKASGDFPMASFVSYTMVGVNSGTDTLLESMMLAEWITNEGSQTLFLTNNSQLPTNTEVAKSELISADPVLAAFAAQAENSICVEETDISKLAVTTDIAKGLLTKGNELTATELLGIVVEKIIFGME